MSSQNSPVVACQYTRGNKASWLGVALRDDMAGDNNQRATVFRMLTSKLPAEIIKPGPKETFLFYNERGAFGRDPLRGHTVKSLNELIVGLMTGDRVRQFVWHNDRPMVVLVGLDYETKDEPHLAHLRRVLEGLRGSPLEVPRVGHAKPFDDYGKYVLSLYVPKRDELDSEERKELEKTIRTAVSFEL